MKLSDVLNYLVSAELSLTKFTGLRGQDVKTVTSILDQAIVDISSTLKLFNGVCSIRLTQGVYVYHLDRSHACSKGTGRQFYILDTKSSPLPSRITGITAVYDGTADAIPINMIEAANGVAINNRTTLQFQHIGRGLIPEHVHVEYTYDPEPVVVSSWEECLVTDFPLPHTMVHAASLFVASRLVVGSDIAAVVEQGLTYIQRYQAELVKLKSGDIHDVLPLHRNFYTNGWI